MTEQEAIEDLEFSKKITRNTELKQSLGMAVVPLEKRISMKPVKKPDKYSDLVQHYYCPSCGRYFGQRGVHNVILFNKERYCQGEGCGQALDWSEE